MDKNPKESLLSLPNEAFRHGILAAVSGGADSAAMLHLLAEALPAKGKLAVAHVNHGLRGADSDADAEFVRSLAHAYHLHYVECRLAEYHLDVRQAEWSENTARNLRYQFLLQQSEALGLRYLAAAHTADDQTETVLHRILRGTGISGLAGMSSVRLLSPAVTLLRPLLHTRRKILLSYLESKEKTFRHDKTNDENHFTRNRIRNTLLPTLRQDFNPQIDDAVIRLAILAKEHEQAMVELIDGRIETALIESLPEQRVVLDSFKLHDCSQQVLREVFVRLWRRHHFPLREMDYEQWTMLTLLFQKQAFRHDLPGGITAEKAGNRLIISKKETILPCN